MLDKLILLTIVSFSLGSLGQIFRNAGINLYLFDIFVFGANLYLFFFLIKKKKFFINLSFLLFTFFSLLSLVISLFQTFDYFFIEKLHVLSFWIRFNLYFGFAYFVFNLLKFKFLSKESLYRVLSLNFYLVIVLNFLQYFFIRDISFMADFGFDPHVSRLTGFFLDPNFLGFYLVLYFYLNEKFLKNKYFSYLSILMVILTESRSAFFTLLILLIFNFFQSVKKTIIFIIFTLLLFLFSNLSYRIEHLNASNDSSSSRISSWVDALEVHQVSPYFGIGFNNYRNYLIGYNIVPPEGFFLNSSNYSDSSILSVLAFSGFLGAIVFLTFYLSYLNKIQVLGFLITIFFNSLIINSLFFPATALLIFLILNLETV
jgi:hypothetical protein